MSKKKITAYLAGPMDHAVDNGIRWRRHYSKILKDKFNMNCIVPNDEEKDVLKNIDLFELKEQDFDHFLTVMKDIIKMDLEFVKNTDLTIVRWNGEPMAGTIGEATLASYLGKKCYLVSNRPNKELPNWFAGCFTKIFKSFKELVQQLEEDYNV